MTTTPVATKTWTGADLRDRLLTQVAHEVKALGRVRLSIVQVGDNPASNAYIRGKKKACEQVGIEFEHIRLREDEGEATLHSVVNGLAHDPEVNAIIVQTPLPQGWDMGRALDAVPAVKDIDGLSSENIQLRRGKQDNALWPATPLGVMRILESLGVDVEDKMVAVIGRGRVVGQPLREILAAAGAEVLAIDKDTLRPARLAYQAEVVVAAAGAPGLVTREWVKPGGVVVDVGLSRVEGDHGKKVLVGDVNRMNLEGQAALVTAAPGGVGPLTVASLLTNTVDATRLQKKLAKAAWRLDA